MFNKYVQCHLSAPDGLRIDRPCETEDENTLSDRDAYKEQLIIVGSFGRENPAHSLSILCKLLEDKIRKLQHFLQQATQCNGNLPNGQNVECIYEDLHWLILIAGHTLSMEAAGEQPLIPAEIMTYSKELHETGKVDITTSLKVLAMSADGIEQIENAENVCDPIVRLVSAVFRLCEIENKAIEFKMNLCLSTEVTCDLMWFINFWAESYLFMLNEYYSTMSETLQTSFSADTPGGKWTLDFILNKICVNVQNFSSENGIINESIGLFVSLVKPKHK